LTPDALVDRICRAIQVSFDWPNSYFVPDDMFDVLIWDPTPELRLAAFASDLRKELGVDVTALRAFEDPMATLKCFVDEVRDARKPPP